MGHQSHSSRRIPPSVALLAPVLAVLGLAVSRALAIVQLHTTTIACDFKTVLASARAFMHSQSPYDIPTLDHVFTAQNIVHPMRWADVMPVYPPFTLALIAPLALPSFAFAIWTVYILSGLLFAAAAGLMVRRAYREANLPIVAVLAIAAAIGSSPPLSFAFTVLNPALPCAALCILVCSLHRRVQLRAVLLAAALVLKPHLAIWIVLALFLQRNRESRAVAIRSAAVSIAFVLVASAFAALQGHLISDWQAYVHLMRYEVGSAAAMSSHAPGPVPLDFQNTSAIYLAALLPHGALLAFLALAACAAALFMRSRQAKLPVAAAAWTTLGLLVTYHRNYDAILLFIALPFLAADLLQPRRRLLAIATLATIVLSWIPLAPGHLFLGSRQAALCAAILAVLLIVRVWMVEEKQDANLVQA